jgi:glycosyltransferase involved in cell wall biosynthesis
MAVGVGAKVVSIFGPVDEKVYGPFDMEDHFIITSEVECRPCYKKFRLKNCNTYECIKDIEVDKVFDVVYRIMENNTVKLSCKEKHNNKISVIITTYNRAKMIGRAINSVFLQKVDAEIELLIVDDGSTDNTEKIIRCIKDERIRYIKFGKNYGRPIALNKALQEATGKYIAILDSDDEWMKDKLQRQLNIFNIFKDKVWLVFSNCIVKSDKEYCKISKKIKSGFVSINKGFPASVFTQPSNWMFRKEMIKEVGFFDQVLKRNQDTDYFARMVRKKPAYFLNEVLAIMHVHDSYEGRDIDDVAEDIRLHLLSKWLPEMKKDKKYLCDFYYCIGKHFVRVKDFRKAVPWLLKAIKTNPFEKRVYGKLIKALVSRGRNAK